MANTGSFDTSYADTSLVAGTTRHYRVSAINTVGTGSASASATTTTATPGPPRDVRVIAGTGKVTVAWQAPEFEGASAITHYEYQRKESSEPSGTWTTAETVAFGTNSSSAILRDPTTLDDYDVRAQTFYTYWVRAVNAAGAGARSQFNSATTGAALTVKIEVAQPEVAENEGPVAVTVVAELPATGPNTEKYDLEFQVGGYSDSGTASALDGDYVGLTPLFTFTPGDFQMESGRWVASEPFTVTLIDDAVVEPDETIIVVVERARITDPSHPFITFPGATDEVTVTIVNDDVPEWAVSVAPATIAEAAGTATVTVSTGGVTFAAAQTIDLSFDGGSATAGTDFTVADANGNALTSPYALTLSMGESSVTATITAVDDAVDDDDEQIQVTATQNGDKLGEAQTLTIIDDDTASTGIELGLNPASVTEHGGAQQGRAEAQQGRAEAVRGGAGGGGAGPSGAPRGAAVGAAEPSARARGDAAGGGRAAGVVPAHDAGGAVPAGRGAGAGLVPAEVAHRGLAPAAQDGLQGGVPGASDGGADRAGGDDQRGDRMAADGDDAAGPRHAGTAGRDAVFRHRDRRSGGLCEGSQAAAAGQHRAGAADDGHAGRVAGFQAQALCGPGPPSPVGRLHPAGHYRASLRTESPSRPRQQTLSEAV